MRRAEKRRPSSRTGQALVEFTLVLPVLVVLLVGAAQVGALLYAQVTLDTASREGARAAAEQPNNSAAYSSGAPLAITKLTTAISRNQSNVTSLTVAPLIKAIGANQPVLLVSTSLQGGQEVTTSSGAIVGATSVPVHAFTAITAYATGAPVLNAHQCTVAEYGATANPANPACAAVSQSLGLLAGNNSVNTFIAPLCTLSSGVDLSALGVPSCLTGSNKPSSCTSTTVDDGDVVVVVTYNVPIFVPIIGNFLATPGASGAHTDVAFVVNRVVPCTMDVGGRQ